MAGEAGSLLTVEGLSISFGGLRALRGVGFEVTRGQVYSIIGPNGAGKTTLFNCLSGIYRPDAGRVVFRGEEIQGLRPDAVARRGLARTFQNLELFARMSVMENLMLGRHLHMKTGVLRGALLLGRWSFAAREEVAHRARVEEIVEHLELAAVRDKPVGSLPYGTQKRVELGRALALEPELLLLDEPCAGMNAEERQDLVFWVQDIRAETGATVLLIEHDMGLVMDVSDRVLVLNFGEAIAEGTPAEVRRHPEVLRAYLGEDEPSAAAS